MKNPEFNNMKGYNDNFDIEGVDTHTGIHSKTGIPYIAFRGTDRTANWEQNGAIWDNTVKLKSGKTVRLHKGFDGGISKNWDSLEKQIRGVLGTKKKDKPSGTLLVTGHSLGGALATMFTLYLKDRHPDVKVHLISVAAPRSMDAEGARFVEANTLSCYRLVNAQCLAPDPKKGKSCDFTYDAVVEGPTASGSTYGYTYYVHPGTQITLGIEDGTQQLDKSEYTLMLKKQLHSGALYVHRLKQMADKAKGILGENEICPKRYSAHGGNVKVEPVEA